ncbi:MAG: endonuclease V [Acidobacteriota bacterium]
MNGFAPPPDSRFREALSEQVRLSALRREAPLPEKVRYVAGADVSCRLWGRTFWGGFAVCDLEEGFAVADSAVVRMEVDFPYVPGLLAFREVPVLAEAYSLLRVRPDAVLVDAQGTAHPRRFGSAAHLGVALGVPTVGCAKSRLCGEHGEPGPERGAFSPLLLEGETVGAVLRTRAGVRPVYVSPGHLSDLTTCLDLVLRCSPRWRLPEPIRRAHLLVNGARRGAARRDGRPSR